MSKLDNSSGNEHPLLNEEENSQTISSADDKEKESSTIEIPSYDIQEFESEDEDWDAETVVNEADIVQDHIQATSKENDLHVEEYSDQNLTTSYEKPIDELENDLSPSEIVKELDRYIISQKDAKRAIAISLRNRKRRMLLDDWLRDEVNPKNILMIGPSGVGKTEIARRAARITHCPFLKVEATKFTEVGYIGRDVDSIPRDLVDNAFKTLRQAEIDRLESQVKEAVEERILDCFVHSPSSVQVNTEVKQIEKEAARNLYRKRLRDGVLDEKEIEIELTNQSVGVEIMGPPGMEEMTNQLQHMMQNLSMGRTRSTKIKVKDAMTVLQQEEASKLLNEEELKRRAVEWVEQYGIVFIDEIDKVCRRGEIGGADVSREGVQRDLLPLIEGSTVSTKYGMVRTDHILFITAGAFHSGQKPSDLIPELQGRLPIRVELKPLTAKDFERILHECHASLLVQYKALIATEGVNIEFTDDAIARIAEIAYLLNEKVENIGARRLHTVMERLLEDVSFEADELKDKHITIDVNYVNQQLAELAANEDSSHYIL
jgi:ATP-dependent HslUV protease ATP-binding subunit HslU